MSYSTFGMQVTTSWLQTWLEKIRGLENWLACAMEAQRSWTHLHTLAQDRLEKDLALLQDTIIGTDGKLAIVEVEEKVSALSLLTLSFNPDMITYESNNSGGKLHLALTEHVKKGPRQQCLWHHPTRT